MLIAGSDDGVYRLDGITDPAESTAHKLLDSDRVMRVRTFDALDGIFAATASGLYHSGDGETWTDLGVPTETVYSVGASTDGDQLYAGTRPAHVYAASVDGGVDDPSWRECEGFQELPSREEWHTPRHEDLAQVRDVHGESGPEDRVVAAVEVGGVHLSDDRGETWTERRGDVHDDVHELLVDGDEFVAATGFGLFRSTDAGRSWTRLDEGFDQRYFRSVSKHDGDLYAGGALSNSATWDDPDADPALFVCRDGETLDALGHPRADETVTGMATIDGDLVVATHRGSVLRRADERWQVVASFPTPGDVTGTYTPLCRVEQ